MCVNAFRGAIKFRCIFIDTYIQTYTNVIYGTYTYMLNYFDGDEDAFGEQFSCIAGVCACVCVFMYVSKAI